MVWGLGTWAAQVMQTSPPFAHSGMVTGAESHEVDRAPAASDVSHDSYRSIEAFRTTDLCEGGRQATCPSSS
jgi:hypothetical protein